MQYFFIIVLIYVHLIINIYRDNYTLIRFIYRVIHIYRNVRLNINSFI